MTTPLNAAPPVVHVKGVQINDKFYPVYDPDTHAAVPWEVIEELRLAIAHSDIGVLETSALLAQLPEKPK